MRGASGDNLTLSANPPVEQASPSTRRIGFLALCAAILFPGLGHLIAHQFRRAAFWFGISAAIGALTIAAILFRATLPLLLILVPLTLIVEVLSWIDAFRFGHRFRAPVLGHPLIKYPLGLLLIASLPMWHFVKMYEKSHLLEAFRVSGESMTPTLSPGDLILVQKFPKPKRWDIVAFASPDDGKIYVKRLVGLPSEKIEIVNGVVHVNGQPQIPPVMLGPYLSYDRVGYPIHSFSGHTGCEHDPITLASDEFYVLGDNSPVSLDSRYFQKSSPGHQRGTLSRSSIIGVATVIYWPAKRWQRLN